MWLGFVYAPPSKYDDGFTTGSLRLMGIFTSLFAAQTIAHMPIDPHPSAVFVDERTQAFATRINGVYYIVARAPDFYDEDRSVNLLQVASVVSDPANESQLIRSPEEW